MYRKIIPLQLKVNIQHCRKMYNYTLVTSKQTEVVTSMKALVKLVEVNQLSSRLDGTLSQSHCDWAELHQVRQSHQYITSLSFSSL